MFWLLIRRDLTLIARSPALWMPVMFFVLVAALFPFAVGPDARLLARIAPGVVWVAALLAALLPVETLIAPDVEDGTIDQLASRGIAMEMVVAARILAHWLGFAVPLIAALPVAAVLLGMDGAAARRLALALLLGTPALAALGTVAAALTATLRGGGALAGLIVLPLALPILIFGVGADAPGALKLLAAASLVALAVSPFAAAAALKQD
ncbi:heme exporter protein CcmB [Polymorphobacter fuscus]|uniref:Heme exporter protein B n=1 Tax=Sandarakinorhabdus fusca TaxID=1439888 RepID=A0A7C9GP04_9SPHN|nr:heme exporter protein CcmB [Polymorphobacter fuscus]KAB7647849.1 heme exporter protein CcmB [Polymorphobacter fuscus]MQT17155.1 heme exporter protein CcmB [Polymorphobacter fuscus]NJC08852.1 heme exporter protein B [Polymorphobacter fuscus]